MNSHYMGFAGIEQDGESIIFLSIYKKYWEIGFKTRLYDWLSPEAYLDSLRRASDRVKLEEKEWVLDAGCGSGLLLSFLAVRLAKGGDYLGMDILPAGLTSLKSRVKRWRPNRFAGLQADLSRSLPLADASVSCVVAHFSVYTLPSEKERRQAYREFWRVLKPGGLLVTANPAYSYNAVQIICASLEQLQREGRFWRIKKYMLYPLTLRLGLRYIEKQLQSGRWHGYQADELRDEVAQAGFSIEHSEPVYGGSGFLVTGRKREV